MSTEDLMKAIAERANNESNVAAVEFLKRQPLDPHQMEKVAHGNAERILRL